MDAEIKRFLDACADDVPERCSNWGGIGRQCDGFCSRCVARRLLGIEHGDDLGFDFDTEYPGPEGEELPKCDGCERRDAEWGKMTSQSQKYAEHLASLLDLVSRLRMRLAENGLDFSTEEEP